MKRLCIVAALTVLAPSVHAQSGGMKGMEMKEKDMPMKMDHGPKSKVYKGKGTVKSVDPGKGTVSLSHEPIRSLNWPAMTMTFKAQNPAMLEKVQPGAIVEFTFEQSGKDYVITEIK